MMMERRRPAGSAIAVAPLFLAVLLGTESSRSSTGPVFCTAFAPSAISRRPGGRVTQLQQQQQQQPQSQEITSWTPTTRRLTDHPAPKNSNASRRQLLILKASQRRDNNNNRNSNKPRGVYSRPSAAIEKGSGFYVPGLEGSRVRAIFGVLVLVLGYWNHAAGGVSEVVASTLKASGLAAETALAQTTSEIIALTLGSFLIVQGIVEAAKESGMIVVLTDRNDPNVQQQQRQMRSSNMNNDNGNGNGFYGLPPSQNMRDANVNPNGGSGFVERANENRDGYLLSDQDLFVSDKSQDQYRQFDNYESDMRYSDDGFVQGGNGQNNNKQGVLGGLFSNNNNNSNNNRNNQNNNRGGRIVPSNGQNNNQDFYSSPPPSGLNDMENTSFDSSRSFQANERRNGGGDSGRGGPKNPIETIANLVGNKGRRNINSNNDDNRGEMVGNRSRRNINSNNGNGGEMILSQNNRGFDSPRRGGAMVPKTSNGAVNTDLGLDVMASTNLTNEQKECARWIGASIISMTPATHVLMVDYDGYGGPEILFSLGNFGNTFNDPNTANYIMSAVTTVQNSTGGRVAVPTTHRSANLLPEFARKSVVLQRLPTFSPPGSKCLIVGSNQVLQAYASNDLAWFGSLVTYFSSI